MDLPVFQLELYLLVAISQIITGKNVTESIIFAGKRTFLLLRRAGRALMRTVFNSLRISLAVWTLGFILFPVLGSLPRAQDQSVSLQVASFETEAVARKEVERLKLLGVKAALSPFSDAQKKIWYVVHVDSFRNKEEAQTYGNNLKAKNIINDFKLSTQDINKIKKIEEKPTTTTPAETKSSAPRDKRPGPDGPLKVQEGPDFLRLELLLDRQAIPEVRSEKGEAESRILLIFRTGKSSFLPLEFERREGLLRSFSVLSRGKEYTLTLGLNPEFNYQVAQDYFERERLYTLTITKIP
jgi:hypothetical protein